MSGEATKKQQTTQNPREGEKSNHGTGTNQRNPNYDPSQPNYDPNNPNKQTTGLGGQNRTEKNKAASNPRGGQQDDKKQNRENDQRDENKGNTGREDR